MNTYYLYVIVNIFLCRHGLIVRCTGSENIQIYMHTHIYIYTRTHTYTLPHYSISYTCIHTYAQHLTHTLIHTYSMQKYPLTAILAVAQTHIHTYTPPPRHFSCHAHIYTHHLTRNDTHTQYTHHLIRNDTHTHTRTYTHRQFSCHVQFDKFHQ